MNVRDFKITENIKNIEADKFCSSCFKSNPENDAGYSSCCHEDIVNKELALKFSKRRDISNFIKIKFNEKNLEIYFSVIKQFLVLKID